MTVHKGTHKAIRPQYKLRKRSNYLGAVINQAARADVDVDHISATDRETGKFLFSLGEFFLT